MNDLVSTRINTIGAFLLVGCLSAAASVPLFNVVYSYWSKVTPYCFWPPGDTLLLGLPFSGVISGGIAGTYVLYQSYHIDAAIRFARCIGMIVLTAVLWHLLMLQPSVQGQDFQRFSESFAEELPVYFFLAVPAGLLLRWQHRTAQRLQQLRKPLTTQTT